MSQLRNCFFVAYVLYDIYKICLQNVTLSSYTFHELGTKWPAYIHCRCPLNLHKQTRTYIGESGWIAPTKLRSSRFPLTYFMLKLLLIDFIFISIKKRFYHLSCPYRPVFCAAWLCFIFWLFSYNKWLHKSIEINSMKDPFWRRDAL